MSFYLYLALKSDKILGELSLWTNGAKWNATRRPPVCRYDKLKTATLACAVVLFLLSDATANTYAVMRSVMWATCVSLLHAVLRPIDLKGTPRTSPRISAGEEQGGAQGRGALGVQVHEGVVLGEGETGGLNADRSRREGANGVGSTNGNAGSAATTSSRTSRR